MPLSKAHRLMNDVGGKGWLRWFWWRWWLPGFSLTDSDTYYARSHLDTCAGCRMCHYLPHQSRNWNGNGNVCWICAGCRAVIYLFIYFTLALVFFVVLLPASRLLLLCFFYIFILFFLLTFDFVIAPLYARMAVWLQIYYPFCFDRTGVLRAANKKLIIKDFDMCAKKKRG